MGSVDMFNAPLEAISKFAGNVADLFKGLDYFTGEKFADLINGGYMK